jgi:hypothetical protein
MASVHVQLDEAAMEELLHSPTGMVGRYIMGLSIQMAAQARALAPLRDPSNASWVPAKSTSYPSAKYPGPFLKPSVKPQFGYTGAGNMYGGVQAAYGPTLFLEEGGGRYGHAIRDHFLTHSLYDVAL